MAGIRFTIGGANYASRKIGTTSLLYPKSAEVELFLSDNNFTEPEILLYEQPLNKLMYNLDLEGLRPKIDQLYLFLGQTPAKQKLSLFDYGDVTKHITFDSSNVEHSALGFKALGTGASAGNATLKALDVIENLDDSHVFVKFNKLAAETTAYFQLGTGITSSDGLQLNNSGQIKYMRYGKDVGEPAGGIVSPNKFYAATRDAVGFKIIANNNIARNEPSSLKPTLTGSSLIYLNGSGSTLKGPMQYEAMGFGKNMTKEELYSYEKILIDFSSDIGRSV